MSRSGKRAEEYLVEIRRYFQDSLGGAPLDLLDDDPSSATSSTPSPS
jgi:hypothetical protein